MAEKKTSLEERYSDEILTDNASLNHYAQCKDCFFRDKTTVKGIECGWKKGYCKIFEYPESKPAEVYNNTGECEYHEKS